MSILEGEWVGEMPQRVKALAWREVTRFPWNPWWRENGLPNADSGLHMRMCICVHIVNERETKATV